MHKITSVTAIQGFRVNLTFDDGICGIADLSHLAGRGVFRLWDDRSVFESVSIGDSGELVWGNEIDLCPDTLYMKVTGKAPTDIFPKLKHELAHA
jgi:hypothetical protein